MLSGPTGSGEEQFALTEAALWLKAAADLGGGG